MWRLCGATRRRTPNLADQTAFAANRAGTLGALCLRQGGKSHEEDPRVGFPNRAGPGLGGCFRLHRVVADRGERAAPGRPHRIRPPHLTDSSSDSVFPAGRADPCGGTVDLRGTSRELLRMDADDVELL